MAGRRAEPAGGRLHRGEAEHRTASGRHCRRPGLHGSGGYYSGQFPADDTSAEWKTTHFDYHAFDANLLKLDILGHDDPTMMRMLQDLTGVDPTTIPMNDPKVMSLFNSTDALGVPPEQIRTPVATYGFRRWERASSGRCS